MKQVTYSITFLVDDEVTDDEISFVCGNAYVQVLEPEVQDEGYSYSFDSTIVSEEMQITPGVSPV